jgi:cysteine desulfuration protein SufE
MTVFYQLLKEKLKSKSTWQDKYREIMLLGKQLPSLPDQLKIESAKVSGCESNVWLHIGFDDKEQHLLVSADSDTRIVKGLIYIITSLVNGCTIEQFQNLDIQNEFDELGLTQHLSPSRGNGIRAIAKEIKAFAQSHTA